MKVKHLKSITIVAVIALLGSCTKTEEIIKEIKNEAGEITLTFDNVYADEDFVLNKEYTLSNGEKIKPSTATYIISNVVLTKEDGSVYAIPKSKSYFIVDESKKANTAKINLMGIPTGKYTKITFGIGIDEAQYKAGASGQGDLTERAREFGMMWSWQAGYKFIKFEGEFTSATKANEEFKVHTEKTGDVYNYAQSELSLTEKAIISPEKTSYITIKADLSKILDGEFKPSLEQTPQIMGGEGVRQITQKNVKLIFSVGSVQNTK